MYNSTDVYCLFGASIFHTALKPAKSKGFYKQIKRCRNDIIVESGTDCVIHI